jgi:hypothetical protein
MAEDKKFRFDAITGRFVNRVSGEEIPDDEPVIIFRARDVHALGTLRWYLSRVKDPHHKLAVQEALRAFIAYQTATPWALKEPGITRSYNLEDEGKV